MYYLLWICGEFEMTSGTIANLPTIARYYQLLPTNANYCRLLPTIAYNCQHSISNSKTQVYRDHCLGNIYPLFAWEIDCSSSHRTFRDPPFSTQHLYVDRRSNNSFDYGTKYMVSHYTTKAEKQMLSS